LQKECYWCRFGGDVGDTSDFFEIGPFSTIQQSAESNPGFLPFFLSSAYTECWQSFLIRILEDLLAKEMGNESYWWRCW
jgi:hypothetical protein